MAKKYSFPTDGAPIASGIPPEVLAHILAYPIDVPLLGVNDERPFGKWCLQPRMADKGRSSDVVYLYRPNGSRVSTRVPVSSDDWELRAELRARAVIAMERDALLSRIAPEMVPVCDLLGDYLDAAGARADRGEIKEGSIVDYRKRVARLAIYLKETTVDKVGPDFPDRYFTWIEEQGFSFNTAIDDLSLLRRGINEAMSRRKSSLRVHYHLPLRRGSEKRPFTPPEFDRYLLAALGFVFKNEHTLLMEADPDTGEMRPVRRSPEEIARRAPFFIAVQIGVGTGTRKMATCELSWVNVGGPWIDLDEGVLHRIGDNQRETSKRRGHALLSQELLDLLRPIAEADLKSGCIWVVHDANGRRLQTLDVHVWREILKDACVEKRVYHATKDTAVQIARTEKMPLHDTAEYFRTTPRTLTMHYGSDFDLGLQTDISDAMGKRVSWRRKHVVNEARKAVAQSVRDGRAARVAPWLPASMAPAAPSDGSNLPAVILAAPEVHCAPTGVIGVAADILAAAVDVHLASRFDGRTSGRPRKRAGRPRPRLTPRRR